jgi:hypothetical protein
VVANTDDTPSERHERFLRWHGKPAQGTEFEPRTHCLEGTGGRNFTTRIRNSLRNVPLESRTAPRGRLMRDGS